MAEETKTEEVALEPYKLFEVERNDQRSYALDGRIINLELGVPKNCVELYKRYKAFPYLKLKKGAQVLFTDLSENEVLNLIQSTKVVSDVKILSSLITSPEGKAIVATRLRALKTPH